MILSLINHSFRYESENVVRIFFPLDKITVIDSLPSTDEDSVVTEVIYPHSSCHDVTVNCSASISGTSRRNSGTMPFSDSKEIELFVARGIFEVLQSITGYTPPWGILTGVRPSKLMRHLIANNGEDEAEKYFKRELLVSDEKTQLAASVSAAEQQVISLSEKNSYSLYVSVPFCPTRCSYCSFVSHSISQAKKLIPDYVRLLCEELSEFSSIASDLGLKLETIYFGGGTPTSLDSESLQKITDTVYKMFDLSQIKEYTIEAGRPDTITDDKLKIMKDAGVTRISINPQTFNDRVLENIGRHHSPSDTVNAFEMARNRGFDNINMDLIAGLPGDTFESFCDSLNKALTLSPENITVHTLALKRASTLVTNNNQHTVSRDTQRMLSFASDKLYGEHYFPYYMYRQSKSVGNLENTGWSKLNRVCFYNIYMMEEIHTVFAAGAGAVTKLKSPCDNKIERIFNFKYPYEYIGRFDELRTRKNRIYDFYTENTTENS